MATTPSAVTNPVVLTLPQRTPSGFEQFRSAIAQNNYDLRVAMPAVVLEFDADRQVVTVQAALTEMGVVDQLVQPVQFRALVDLPIVFPRAGGFSLTFPIAVGDECVVLFNDADYRSWWQNGGSNNDLMENHRHDTRNGFAFFGPWSKPRALANYSVDSCQLRSDDGTVGVDLRTGQITIQAPTVTITSGSGVPTPVLLKEFLTWFQTVYMPSVVYVTSPPAVPTTGLYTTVLEAE